MGTEHTELTNSDMSSGFTNEDVTEDMARVLKTIQEMSLSCIEKPVSCGRSWGGFFKKARNVDGI